MQMCHLSWRVTQRGNIRLLMRKGKVTWAGSTRDTRCSDCCCLKVDWFQLALCTTAFSHCKCCLNSPEGSVQLLFLLVVFVFIFFLTSLQLLTEQRWTLRVYWKTWEPDERGFFCSLLSRNRPIKSNCFLHSAGEAWLSCAFFFWDVRLLEASLWVWALEDRWKF